MDQIHYNQYHKWKWRIPKRTAPYAEASLLITSVESFTEQFNVYGFLDCIISDILASNLWLTESRVPLHCLAQDLHQSSQPVLCVLAF